MRKTKYNFHTMEKGDCLRIPGANLQNVRNRANEFGQRYGMVIISSEIDKGVLVQRVR